MSSNWVLALDNLAASGVIDFDAPAFLLGQKPRYVGNPSLEHLPLENPMYLPEGVKMKDIPQIDIYEKSQNHDLVNNPSWKKWLFAGVAVAGLILAGGAALAGKTKAAAGLNSIKNTVSNIKLPNVKVPKFIQTFASKAVEVLKKIFSYIKKPFQWLAAKIHK